MRWYKTAMEQPAEREKIIQETLDRFARDNQGLRQKMSRFLESDEEAARIIEGGGDVSSRLASLYSVSNVVPVGTWVKPTNMHPEWGQGEIVGHVTRSWSGDHHLTQSVFSQTPQYVLYKVKFLDPRGKSSESPRKSHVAVLGEDEFEISWEGSFPAWQGMPS